MRRRRRKTHLLLALAPDNTTVLGIVGAYGAERTALRTQTKLYEENYAEFARSGDPRWLTRRYMVTTMEVR
jgi:hypothetical protein